MPSGDAARAVATTLGSLLCALVAGPVGAASEPLRELVICADPGNLPFSNEQGEGFENRIAALVAQELGASVRYVWNATWKSSFLRPLRKGTCDVVMGVPQGLSGVAITRPYYTSTYVFVSRRDRALHLGSFDDSSLVGLKIGLHALGASGANTPPAHALARRGMTANVVGYLMWGDATRANPQADILAAVAAGEIDTAVVWGPIGGYFARPYDDRLELYPVTTTTASPTDVQFAYPISVGVRDGNEALRTELEQALDRQGPAIQAILHEFGIPLVPTTPAIDRHASGETQ